MKKVLLLTIVIAGLAQLSIAQIKIGTDGKVGIQVGTTTPLSSLSIGGAGSVSNKVSITNNDVGLSISRTGTSAISWLYGFISISDLTSSYSIGVRGQAFSSTAQSSGQSWGVMGYAGNATNGYNYGVMGVLGGSNTGAGIIGTVGGSQSVYVPGTYAGYFVGDVKVTGLVTSSNITSSDRRLKDNIESLNNKKNVVNDLVTLNPVSYNIKQRYVKAANDTATAKPLYDEKSQLYTKKQYGLVAQEVQEKFPDLVYEDQEGYLAVNYNGLIPVLIQSIKELTAEIEVLKKQLNAVKK